MDFVHCILWWEQQWVRWSGRQEIRWLCPPHRSLSPRRPSDAAAPLLSICSLPSRYLPLGSRVETCVFTYSLDCTVEFIVTVWLWKLQYATSRLEAGGVLSVPSSFPLSRSRSRLNTVAVILMRCLLLLPRGWGYRHQCGRHRRWQIWNADNMQFERKRIHATFIQIFWTGLIWIEFSSKNIFCQNKHTASCKTSRASIKMKTHHTTLLQYAMLYSPCQMFLAASIKVVSDVVSSFLTQAVTSSSICLDVSGIQSGRRPDGVLRRPHTRGPPHRARPRLREPFPGEEVLLHHPLMTCR